MKFSIVTPTYNRADGRLQRCIDSTYAQQYASFEHIIVDDGSTDGTRKFMDSVVSACTEYQFLPRERSGRVPARNAGMRAASGEWICWLDSDDALDPMYLATFAHNIEQEPECKLWVCGAIVHGVKKDADGNHLVPAHTTIRQAWMPPINSDGVHDNFRSGKVGTGMFMFHRSCLDKIGYMPDDWHNHNDIAGGIDEWLGYETGYKRGGPWCGNPYGDDWAQFRKLTMFYRVSLIQAALYVHYVR